jgi:hypothetical protein
MHRYVRTLTAPALAAALLLGCEQATEVATAALTDLEARELAAAWDETAAAALDALGGPSFATDPIPALVTTTFTRSGACPRGGTATVSGTRLVDGDRDAGTLTVRLTASRVDDACAFPVRRGGTLTVTTTPSIELAAEQTFTRDAGPGVRTATQRGSFAWSHSGGASGTCEVALTATWDPAAGSYALTGTFCGRDVQVTRTRGA